MPLFKKVLYPTDFSDLAEVALDYVKKLKEAGAQEVVVLHVIHPLEFSLPQFDDPFALDVATIYAHIPEIEKAILESHEEALKKIEEELKGLGFKVKTVMTVGEPADEIVNVAKQEQVKVIVMGYHGKGLLERILEMGSTTRAVIEKAHCPVLVVKKEG
ncbi:universal stress protein [Thermovibrio ammonificans]|jgi:nucleotide-binding universal stress UspA family protein|uniref:UspA domain-containing protein n=1 Tax=Thermovibrio ammonificans (strain DSM 15698 / JCM 12110 / HB-1) TaxID=648996 RepID=E8T4M1_THEA1|nr:universal stress protein [Thermovibrio ammonificans]ADU97479.1 UspA domain-containing protein [Thermovibrio ammonificans HB-1]